MVSYYPLYVNRSDGKLQANTARGREPNEPQPEQLNQKPSAAGVCDYYRLCDHGDPKEVDWRRKLGGLLMKEIGGKEPKDRNYILAALPENYRVYEHVKFKVKDGELDKTPSSKTHAGGGNDRQDAYLYGHPQGRKKRYRSPAEFFPHLLWLATDENGDSDNCSCKFCSPEELESDVQSKIAAKQAKTEARIKAAEQAKQNAQAAATAPAAPASTAQSIAAAQSLAAPQSAKKGTPLPPLKTPEQKEDCGPNGKYLFRTGEIVWFARGQAWGLGIILKRELQGTSAVYTIQPLSHPLQHAQVVQSRPEQLRPWLAWSPPDCTHAQLNATEEHPNRVYTYDSVDWPALERGAYGQGLAEVDGSILAVKRAETTFTPFDLISSTPSPNDPQLIESRYNGIYIGGEKIWVGDALRMRTPEAAEVHILVLHAIVETSNRDDPSRPRVSLVGDTYGYSSRYFLPPGLGGGPDDAALPARVREDLARRNRITAAAASANLRHSSHWQLKSTNVALAISQVKGRWYETTALYPLLDGDGYAKQTRDGTSTDVTAIMNGQGDCNRPFGTVPSSPSGFKAADTKVARREDAFVRAVPPGMIISGSGLGSTSATAGQGQVQGQGQMGKIAQRPQQQPQLQHQFPQQQQQQFANGKGAQFGAAGGVGGQNERSEFEQFMDYEGTNQGGQGN